MIVTSSTETGHGALLIVQRKTLDPTARPVTPELGEEGDAMVPEPLISVQVPAPEVGVFPDRAVLDEQIV